MNFSEKLQQTLGKAIKDASNEEIYAALLNTVKEAAADKGRNISEKCRTLPFAWSLGYPQNTYCSIGGSR